MKTTAVYQGSRKSRRNEDELYVHRVQRELGFISSLAAARTQNRTLRPELGIRVRVGVGSGQDRDNYRTDDIQTRAEADNAKSKNEGRRSSFGEGNRDTQAQWRCTQEVRIEISIARKVWMTWLSDL